VTWRRPNSWPNGARGRNFRPCLAQLRSGASTPGRIRTCDLRFRKPLLYPLSYRRVCGAPILEYAADWRRGSHSHCGRTTFTRRVERNSQVRTRPVWHSFEKKYSVWLRRTREIVRKARASRPSLDKVDPRTTREAPDRTVFGIKSRAENQRHSCREKLKQKLVPKALLLVECAFGLP
jgi:hypothetical protein